MENGGQETRWTVLTINTANFIAHVLAVILLVTLAAAVDAVSIRALEFIRAAGGHSWKTGQSIDYSKKRHQRKRTRAFSWAVLMPLIPALWEAKAGGSIEVSKVEAAVSHDCTTALQSETLSQKTKYIKYSHSLRRPNLSAVY